MRAMPAGHMIPRMLAIFVAVLIALYHPLPVDAIVGGSCTPSGGTLIISTDADVDGVKADCSVIEGNLDVGCDLVSAPACACTVTNLNAFRLVEKITGYLRIKGCNNLTNFAGLNRLKFIEGKTLFSVPEEANGFALWIENNDRLASLSGLQNLSTVGRHVSPPGRVYIADNDALCGTEHVDWRSIVSDTQRCVFDIAGLQATSGTCGNTGCNFNCGCGDKCFGTGLNDCQGYCDGGSDDTALLIVSLALTGALLAIFTFIFILCITDRVGCRLAVYKRLYYFGRFPKDLQDESEWATETNAAPLEEAWGEAVELPPLNQAPVANHAVPRTRTPTGTRGGSVAKNAPNPSGPTRGAAVSGDKNTTTSSNTTNNSKPVATQKTVPAGRSSQPPTGPQRRGGTDVSGSNTSSARAPNTTDPFDSESDDEKSPQRVSDPESDHENA